MLSFFTVSKCYNFYVIIYGIIFRLLSFMLSFDVVIFHGQQMLSFLCYHFPLYIFCVIIYYIIFRVLSFMLSFDVIIFHGQQMLSFLCYHFPLYIFCVIFMLSFDVNIKLYHRNDNNS